ncbi:MAG TPA: hypothetical protein VMS89_01885 [Methanoregulaceae archaeon]|nr:hypothetical protein [Methanoregulaceae archaeon]
MPDIGWMPYPNATLFDTTPVVDDPWMGAAANCSCIAGMASLAWVYPQWILQNLFADYSANFFSPNPAAQPLPQTNNLYQNASGGLKYAKSRTSTEYWPSYYEKSYKKLLLGIVAKNNEPNMDGDWNNLSAYAMARMTGWNDSGNQAIPGTAADIWNALKAICAPLSSPGGANTFSAQTKYPAIAITKSNGNPGLNLDREPYASHSYSLLGLYQDAGSNQYVILRDPKSSDVTWPATPNSYALLNNSPWVVTYANYDRRNPRQPIAGTVTTKNIALNNWIFGLKITSTNPNDFTFQKLFNTFAYIS